MKRITGKKEVTIICFFLLWCALATTGLSQPGDPGGDPDVPISGIEWLLVAGGIFGARKIYNRIKK
ncbi:MAG: hypothetical protein WEB30_12145 [Cyclobacteriaceae bacterium]